MDVLKTMYAVQSSSNLVQFEQFKRNKPSKGYPQTNYSAGMPKNIIKYCSFHKQDCEFTPRGSVCIVRRENFRQKNQYPISITEQVCKTCNVLQPVSEYHRDKTVLNGVKSSCKNCIKERDYARYNTWEGYTRKKIVASWSAHHNKLKINKLKVKEGLQLLIDQKYKCLHCGVKLECTFGDTVNKNYYGASLDRIDVSIVGYGNGNAQWLCMSCNNGKNTMDNEQHKEKFHSRDRQIDALKERIVQLTAENTVLQKQILELTEYINSELSDNSKNK